MTQSQKIQNLQFEIDLITKQIEELKTKEFTQEVCEISNKLLEERAELEEQIVNLIITN